MVDESYIPPFASRLPHSLFLDADEGVLLLATPKKRGTPTLALGCVWEVTPRTIAACDETVCLDLARLHEHLVRTLPLGTAMQQLLTFHPAARIPAWERLRAARQEHPVVQAQRAAIARGLPHQSATAQHRLRTFTTLVTLRLLVTELDQALLAKLRTLLRLPSRSAPFLGEWLHKAFHTSAQRLERVRRGVEETLRGAGHQAERLAWEGMGQALARAVDPFREKLPMVNPSQPLGEQILQWEARPLSGGWQFGETLSEDPDDFAERYRCQVLSLHQAPLQSYPGILCAARTPQGTAEPLALWQAWDGPVTVAVNIAAVDGAKEQARLTRQAFWAKLYAKASTKNSTLSEELEKLIRHQFLTGGQTHWGRIHIALWGTEPRLSQGLAEVQRRAQQLRLEFQYEPGTLGSTLAMQMWPLGLDPDYPKEWTVERARRLPGNQLANMQLLYADVTGTRRAAIPFLNARGEAVGWHPFDAPTNAHSAWTGTSGAGKTHAVGHVVNHLMALGASIVIVDPLQRYRFLSETWQANRQTISFANSPCFNPFLGDLGQSHVSFLGAFLKQLASGGGEKLSWEEFNVLSSALSYFAVTWDRSRGEATLTPFVEEVLQTGCFDEVDEGAQQLGRQIARKLKLFYGTGAYRGAYADFVDGPNTFTIQPGLNVIEFAELKDYEGLQGVLFFAVVHLMYQFFRDPGRFDSDKYAFFDEAWAHAKLPETAAEVDHMIRTSRNNDVSVHFLSQLVRDWETPMGEVIRNLVGTTFFLKQEANEVAKVQELFNLSDAEVPLMHQAHKYDDFSSAYMRLDDKQGGLVHIVSDPYTNVQMGQGRALARRRNQAIADAGGDVQAALAALVAEAVAG